MYLHSPAQTYQQARCVLVITTLTAFICLWGLDREMEMERVCLLSFPHFPRHALSRSPHPVPLIFKTNSVIDGGENRQLSHGSRATVGCSMEEAGVAPVPHVSPSVVSLRTDMQNEPHCPPCTYGTAAWAEDRLNRVFVVYSIYTHAHRSQQFRHFSLARCLVLSLLNSTVAFTELNRQYEHKVYDFSPCVPLSLTHATCRKMVGGRRLWCVRSSTTCTPSWRRRRGPWVRRWQPNRTRSWITSGAWPGSTETIWRRAVRSWRWGSRPWRSQRWHYSCRSESKWVFVLTWTLWI